MFRIELKPFIKFAANFIYYSDANASHTKAINDLKLLRELLYEVHFEF